MSSSNASQPTHPVRAHKSVQQSSLAGTWYTDNAEDLKSQIRSFLDGALTPSRDDIIAMILPHAGYVYSGKTTAKAIKALSKSYKRVITLGPTHKVAMPNVLSIPHVSHYQTPLGEVPLDTQATETLLAYNSVFQTIPSAHRSEHSVQIQLPWLQMHLESFEFLPIVVGQCDSDAMIQAARLLKSVVDETTLVIVSTDFTHYGARFDYVPFIEQIPEQLEALDMGAFDAIKTLDADSFLAYQEKTGATICGRNAIAILMHMLAPDTEPHLVEYTTSGAMVDDYTHCVSYVSALFTGQWHREPVTQQTSHKKSGLSEQDQQALLCLARATIKYYLAHNKTPHIEDLGIEITRPMKTKRAAFVTLKKHGRLRGCIGDILPRVPLYQSVINNAMHAATHDYRFEPVTSDECKDLHIEISALTPPKPIESYKDIRIGTDGVILQKEAHSAVFLPQVAPEQGWDITQTLTHLAVKAGLPSNAWKEGAQLLTFQAEIFEEAE